MHRSKPSLSRRQVQVVAELHQRFRMNVTTAAGHLGVDPSTLRRWLDSGIVPGHRTVRGRWWLDPEVVWQIRTHGLDLITRQEAAEVLGVSRSPVTQLANLIQFEMVGSRRMYRRSQLKVVANARDARWARWR